MYIVQGIRCHMYIVQGTRCHMYIVQGTRCNVYFVQGTGCHMYIVQQYFTLVSSSDSSAIVNLVLNEVFSSSAALSFSSSSSN